MSRKHYIAIANTFVVARMGVDEMGDAILDRLALAQSEVFAQDNAAFDRDRFLRACGVNS
jgi:hypothetical protein